MGNLIPPDPNKIEDSKWYCVFCKGYLTYPPDKGCEGDYGRSDCCCVDGFRLKECIAIGQCNTAYTICVSLRPMAQRIVQITGPYDSAEECHEWCD